jgi:molybdate transport system regulatory protein
MTPPTLPLQFGWKFWLKSGNESILGPGDIKLLLAIKEHQNLTKAAFACGYSFKYAWKKLHVMKLKTSRSVVDATKGGKGGGGHVNLTPWGLKLIEIFERVQEHAGHLAEEIDLELKNMDD